MPHLVSEFIHKLQALLPPFITPRRLCVALGVIVCLAIGYIYWELGCLDLIGFTRDDGMYVITSESLAKGGGFHLWNLACNMPQVKYPIGYPLLLMPVWWINPDFPQNQPLLVAVTAFFAAMALIAIFFYLMKIRRSPAWLALLIVLAFACNFYWIFFAAGLMAEAPYLFFSFVVLMFLEPKLKQYCQAQESPSLKTLLSYALIAALPFHLRQIGLCISVACSLYLFLNKRYRDSLVFFITVLCLTVIPWSIWVATQFHSTPLTYETTLASIPYMSEFMHHLKSGQYGIRLLESAGSMVYRILEAMFALIPNFFKIVAQQYPKLDESVPAVFIFDIVLMISAYSLIGYFLLMLIKRSKQCYKAQSWGSISIGCWYLLLYIALCIFWGYEEQMSRFIPMILPLLWWYTLEPLLRRIQAKQHLIRNSVILAILLGVAIIPGFKTFSNIIFVRQHAWIDIEGHPIWLDYVETFAYIDRFLPKKAIIATTHETVIYLHADRKTYQLNDYALKERMVFQHIPQKDAFEERMNHMRDLGVDYILLEPAMRDRQLSFNTSPVTDAFIKQFPNRFRLLYISPKSYVKVYRFFPK